MAIDAKVSFLKRLEERLSGDLTVDAMSRMLSVVSDVMEDFDLRETREWNDIPDDMLDSYIAALQVQGRSQKTIDRYAYIIRKIMDFAHVQTRQVTVYHLRNYLASEKRRGIADSTLEGYRQICSAYFGWLYREALIPANPAANIGTIKVPKKARAIYTDMDFEKLYQACRTVRDRALIHFLASTGCRIGETTELNRDALDFDRLECIVHGKGNKERRVYFDSVTGMLLREYLSKRKDQNEALFVGLRGERLQPGGVRQMLKVLAAKAGVENVHPHRFRRTRATTLARRGMPIQEVATLMGHEKLDTTMRYVVIDNSDVQNDFRRFA